ncbi:hypothetical protein EE612_004993, partial [Oryza sativa]
CISSGDAASTVKESEMNQEASVGDQGMYYYGYYYPASFGGYDENGYFVGYNGLDVHPTVSDQLAYFIKYGICLFYSIYKWFYLKSKQWCTQYISVVAWWYRQALNLFAVIFPLLRLGKWPTFFFSTTRYSSIVILVPEKYPAQFYDIFCCAVVSTTYAFMSKRLIYRND